MPERGAHTPFSCPAAAPTCRALLDAECAGQLRSGSNRARRLRPRRTAYALTRAANAGIPAVALIEQGVRRAGGV
jgi:hypothetical protein